MVLMLTFAFLISYPVFFLFVWGVSRLLFNSLEKETAKRMQEKERILMMARRTRRKPRVVRKKQFADESFVMQVSGT